ncbi:hypothetical protein CL632_03675 [bacterium]|jgi:prevent-host-death family protein|nr:hypothetical protein [bacterium]MDP6571462.1 type II toxin-antitoxin system prevent-host-death family antitoxin [Patescibacteria group bacterium]MDP6756204.1 type II toxin-antitoxin system prevent-host-death family antitoxin [Patescibacteria group bacterium]|tara:strand:+ start:181 stop:402 length:222 start_codon:yes stop_codon:yes gene_type:complete
MNQIVGVKELRENLPAYADAVQDGKSFTVVKRSKPIFKIIPIDEDDDGQWERVVDFTKINKDGVDAREVLNHL